MTIRRSAIKCTQPTLRAENSSWLRLSEKMSNERDLQLLKFADIFEDKFLRQDRDEDRTIDDTESLVGTQPT